MYSAAFSQRMPPVQKLTTVLPSSSARWASNAAGKSENFAMRQSCVPSKVPASTSKSFRVSSIATARPASSWPCASQRASVAGSTAAARPCCGWIVGWFMRISSFLIFTFRRLNGIVSLKLSLVARPANGGSARSARSTQPRSAASSPAMNRLMPSRASRIVPFTPMACALASRRSRSAGRSSSSTKR